MINSVFYILTISFWSIWMASLSSSVSHMSNPQAIKQSYTSFQLMIMDRTTYIASSLVMIYSTLFSQSPAFGLNSFRIVIENSLYRLYHSVLYLSNALWSRFSSSNQLFRNMLQWLYTLIDSMISPGVLPYLSFPTYLNVNWKSAMASFISFWM